MKKLFFLFVLGIVLTPNITLYAKDKPTSQEKSANASNKNIIDQLNEWAQAVGIAWGGPTM
jgi:hypothetical protein